MVFFGGSHQAAGRRQFLLKAATSAALLLIGVATLSGCGGGTDNSDPTPKPSPVTTATVSGRVIENSTAALVSGVVVHLGDLTTTTGTNGQFSFTVPGGSAARQLTLDLSTDYNTAGFARGRQVNLTTTGITITQDELVSGKSTNIGDVKVYSSALPPPPPAI